MIQSFVLTFYIENFRNCFKKMHTTVALSNFVIKCFSCLGFIPKTCLLSIFSSPENVILCVNTNVWISTVVNIKRGKQYSRVLALVVV